MLLEALRIPRHRRHVAFSQREVGNEFDEIEHLFRRYLPVFVSIDFSKASIKVSLTENVIKPLISFHLISMEFIDDVEDELLALVLVQESVLILVILFPDV